MSRVLAIARLTFWEGVRMRIVLVFLVTLVFIMLRLPFALRGDDTVAGRLQAFLAYSIGAVTFLLGVATVFFSCATLANEIRNNSIHLVVTKPVARFEILVGKWLGINVLLALLLVLCGTTIYGFARLIRSQPVQFERDRVNVNDVIWTARLAAHPVVPRQQFSESAGAYVRKLVDEGQLPRTDDWKIASAIEDRINQEDSRWRTVTNGETREYRFENLVAPGGDREAVQIRFKARGIPLPVDELLTVVWAFLDPDTGELLSPPFRTQERSAQRHQFLVRGKAIIRDGRAVLAVTNPYTPDDDTKVFFEGDPVALEVLYKVGSFEENYVKAFVLLFFQLAFISAVGVFFGTFVSFPVACLGTFLFYLVGIAWPFWFDAIGGNIEIWQADIDPFGRFGPAVRFILTPMLNVLFPNFVAFSGAPRLVDGEYISYGTILWCALRTVAAGGLLLLVIGWFVFKNREIAEVQV